MSKLCLASGLVMLAFAGGPPPASAAVAISSPTTGEIWIAGAFGMGVKFGWNNGCSGGRAEIYIQGASVNPLWSNDFGALSASPVTLPVGIVPHPHPNQPGTYTNMICEVNITHTNGTKSSDQVLFKIRN